MVERPYRCPALFCDGVDGTVTEPAFEDERLHRIEDMVSAVLSVTGHEYLLEQRL
jgi:hypothetical protein